MSDSTFLPSDFSTNPNPNYTHLMDQLDLMEFEVSDYLLLEAGSEEDYSTSTDIKCESPNPILPEKMEVPVEYKNDTSRRSNNMQVQFKSGAKKSKMDVGIRIAFRTKSELEIMDDGFKWRKYGKKSVKNSPNPRNYYRCSSGGCLVKKRVERDREDSSYVITTYDGVHNHESPCVVYYNHKPLMVPTGWTLQASHSSSSL